MHLARYIAYWSRERAEKPALRQGSVTLSWRDLGVAAGTSAARLRAAGAARGDRIGCLLPNRLEWCVTFAATQMSEAVCVPLNPLFGPEELRYIAKDAGCKILVSTPRLMAKLDDRYVGMDDDAPAVFDLETGRRVCAVDLFPEAPLEAPERADKEADAAAICYTSGTTGRPKGAVHTHQTIAAMTIGVSRGYGMSAEEIFLLVAPLSFTGGVICNLAVSLALGSLLVLEDGFDPPRTLELIERLGVTAFGGAAIFWQRLAACDGFEAADLRSLRHGFAGGSPVPPEIVRLFSSRGVGIRQAYGCTEACGGATLPTAEAAASRPDACGRPMVGLQLEVRDETGSPAPAGTVGEITMRGPQIMIGYWNRPAETAKAFDGAWFRSGDLGYMNEFDELIVVDRKKNMVISGGVNIYPAEVEAAMLALPRVREAIAFGVPSQTWGEELVAVIVGEAAIDTAAALAALRERLGPYKTPKQLVRSDDPLPRTATGKVERAAAIARYAPELQRASNRVRTDF